MNRLERIALASVIFSSLLLAGILTRNFVRSRAVESAQAPRIRIGEALRFRGFQTGGAAHTLVMVISGQCSYCVNDVPFYRQLSALRGTSAAELRLVAAMPEAASSAQRFLADAGVRVDEVLAAAPAEAGAALLPTLLLVDREGKLEDFWVGELDEGRRRDVLAKLRAACPACGRPMASTIAVR